MHFSYNWRLPSHASFYIEYPPFPYHVLTSINLMQTQCCVSITINNVFRVSTYIVLSNQTLTDQLDGWAGLSRTIDHNTCKPVTYLSCWSVLITNISSGWSISDRYTCVRSPSFSCRDVSVTSSAVRSVDSLGTSSLLRDTRLGLLIFGRVIFPAQAAFSLFIC